MNRHPVPTSKFKSLKMSSLLIALKPEPPSQDMPIFVTMSKKISTDEKMFQVYYSQTHSPDDPEKPKRLRMTLQVNFLTTVKMQQHKSFLFGFFQLFKKFSQDKRVISHIVIKFTLVSLVSQISPRISIFFSRATKALLPSGTNIFKWGRTDQVATNNASNQIQLTKVNKPNTFYFCVTLLRTSQVKVLWPF